MIPGFMVNTGMKALGKTMGLMAMKGVAGDPTMRYIMSAIKGVPGGAFGKAKSAVSSNASDAPNIPPPSKTPYRNRQQNRIPAAALNGGGGSGGSMGGDPSQQMIGELQNIQGMLQGIDSNISSLNQGIDDLNNGLQNVADGNYNNANKSDAILSALEELQNIVGENGANANKSAKDALESMVETRNHIQNVASGIVRPINKNLVNMAGILERIAAANESMLKIQRYAYGLNDGADIKASAIRKASKRVDPSDSKSMDKEAYNKEVLETQKRNIELQMNEEEDSLLYKLYKVTKDTSKSLVKTLAKDTIGLGKDIVTGTAKGAWKHFIRPFAEEHIGLVKTKLATRKEEKQKEMMDVYTQMVKNGDYESAKKLQTKLQKKGISESVLNLVVGKGISSDQAEAYMERIKTKNKATSFDNETRDAIVKGIPFLLSEILKAISGEEKVWNHEMDTLTSKDDYIKSKAAAAKQNLLNVQKSKKRTWFLRNKNMLQYNRDLDKAMSDVNKSEVMAENNMGFVNLYDTAHEGIEKEYNEKGVKNQADKYKRLRYLYGSHLGDNLWDIGKKIGKGIKAAKDWTKEVVTGEYKTEEHDAKGLFERITDNDAVKMKYLLKSSGLNKEQEREALAQMMGSRNSAKPSLSEKIGSTEGDNRIVNAIERNGNILYKILEALGGDFREVKADNEEEKKDKTKDVSSIFNISKDKLDEDKDKKNKKDDHKNLKIIAKHITSLDKETKKHNRWERTKNFFDKMLSIGSGIIGSIGDVISSLFSTGSGIVTGLASLLLGKKITGGIGNLFKGGKGLGKGAAKFAKGAAKMGMRALPVVGAIATAGFAAYDGYKSATDDEAIRAQTGRQEISAKDRLKHGVAGAAAGLVNWIPGLDGINATSVTNTGESLINFISGKGWNTNKEVEADPNKGAGQTAALVKAIMDSMKTFTSTMWEGLKELGSSLGETISSGLNYLRQNFGTIVKTIMGGIWDAGKWIVKNIVPALWEVIKWASGEIWETVKWLGSSIWDGLKWAGGYIWDSVCELGSSIGEKFVEFGRWVVDGISSIGTTIYEGFTGTIDSVKSWFSNAFSFLTDGITNLIEPVKTIGKNIIEGFNGILDNIGSVFKKIGEIIWKPIDWLKGIIWNPIKSILNKLSIDVGDDSYTDRSVDVNSTISKINFSTESQVVSEAKNEEKQGSVETVKNTYNALSSDTINASNKIESDQASNQPKNNNHLTMGTNTLDQSNYLNKPVISKVAPENITVIESKQNAITSAKIEENMLSLNGTSQQQLDALNTMVDLLANMKNGQTINNNNTTNNVIAGSGNTSIRNSSSSNPVNYRDPKQGVKASSISSAAQVAAKS